MATKVYNKGVSWLIEKKKNNGWRFFDEPPSSVADEANKGTTDAKDVLRKLNKVKEKKKVGCFMPRWWGVVFSAREVGGWLCAAIGHF